MQNEYKNILTGYLNKYKEKDGQYLDIKNVSDEDIVIKPGEHLFLNMTPKEVREKNDKIPLFSKSVKVGETKEEAPVVVEPDDIPF